MSQKNQDEQDDLRVLCEGQRILIGVAKEHLELARTVNQARERELSFFQDEWRAWIAEVREQQTLAIRRGRRLMRFYGVLMLLLGVTWAVFALPVFLQLKLGW